MQRLTIALCTHGYFPEQFFGTAVYVRQLAKALQRLGHRPVIIAPRLDPDTAIATLLPPEWIDDIEIYRVLRPSIRDARDSFDDVRLLPALREALAAIAPDVVHVAHFLGLTTALYNAAQSLDLPVFATLTDFHGFCHRGTLLNAWGRDCRGPNRLRSNCLGCGLSDRAAEQPNSLSLAYFSSWFARPTSSVVFPWIAPLLPQHARRDIQATLDRPDHLHSMMSGLRGAIAPTAFLRDAYLRNGFSIPIEVSPFGIEANRAVKPERQAGPLRVGFIGQIGAHKGCHVLVEAARHLRAGSASIGIWGDMARHPSYAAALRRAAAGRSVSFHGSLPLEAMDDALRGLDVLVMPSIWAENAPLTLLQSLACHTPCIVSDQPGMTEFVIDGVNGYVVPPSDPKSLAKAIQMLADEPKLLYRLTTAANYEHDTDAMANHVLDLYSRSGVEWSY